jgi:hypothetical protein
MANKWMTHVKKTMKKMSSQKKSMGKGWFKTVLKAAKSSYHKKGGADSDSDSETKPESAEESTVESPSLAASLGGRRRRKTHKKRRHH